MKHERTRRKSERTREMGKEYSIKTSEDRDIKEREENGYYGSKRVRGRREGPGGGGQKREERG